MINYLTERLLNYLVNKNTIDKQDDVIAFYRYGIEITISSILNVLIILFLSLIFNEMIMGIIFLLIFIPIRQFTGGYHADTYFKCNTIFAVCYTALILFTKFIYIPIYVDVVLWLCEILIVFKFCPIENENKPFRSKKQILKCKIISLGLFVLFGVIACFTEANYTQVIMRTLNLIIVLCLVSIFERRNVNEKAEQNS